MIYFIAYALIGFILIWKNKNDNSRHEKIRIALVIILLTTLASLRDETIGTDVQGYARACYRSALRVKNIPQLAEYVFLNPRGIEPGYLFSVFLSARLFHSLNGVLFTTALITNACMIIGLYRVRKYMNFNMSVIIFCFLFYQDTYNTMRQWMAIAVVVLGMRYLFEKELIPYCLIVLVAVLFHKTALIALALYVIAIILGKKISYFVQAVLIVATVIVILEFQSIIGILISTFSVLGKYAHYAEGSSVRLSFNETIIRIPPVALCLLLYGQMRKENKYHAYWFLILILDLILAQVGSITVYASRVATYFTIARIFELSMACNVGNGRNRFVIKTLVVVYSMMYWAINYIYLMHGETYPYHSGILGI